MILSYIMESVANYKDCQVIASEGYHKIILCKKGEETVILKALKDEYRDNLQYKNLLKKEFERGSKLDHAGIAKYHALVEHPEYGRCIEMEYVEGRTFADYIKENHTEEEKMDIITQLAASLQYAHTRYVVVGNLSPYSIIISKDDRAKIVRLLPTLYETSKESAKTSRYIAPEIRDGLASVDGRADVYSLGMLMKALGLHTTHYDMINKCCSRGRTDRFMDLDAFLEELNNGGKRDIHFSPKKWLIGFAAIAIVAVAVIVFQNVDIHQMVNNLSNGNEEVTDTVNSAQISPDTAEAKPKAAASQDSTSADPMKAQLVASIDSIYKPWIEWKNNGGNQADIARNLYKLRKQINRYYKKAIQGMDNEQRTAFDKLFIEYKAQKEQEFSAGVADASTQQ